MAGTADNGGEHGAGSIVASETGLAHTGAIVNDKGCKREKKKRIALVKTLT